MIQAWNSATIFRPDRRGMQRPIEVFFNDGTHTVGWPCTACEYDWDERGVKGVKRWRYAD